MLMIRVLKREIKMRLKRRIMPKSGVFWFKANNGFKLLIEWPSGLARRIYYEGVYHSETVKYLTENIKPWHLCVDVGANVGYITLIMARRAASVVAFEPDPKLRHLLRLNLKANNVDNVTVRHEAVTDEVGKARFFLNREPMYSGLVGHTGIRDIIEVDTITLDSCGLKPDFVKIDVEGAEVRVLQGMKEILNNHDLNMILEVEPERLGFSSELYDFLDGWNLRNFDNLNVLCWRE